ncbi:hypothetical protein MKX01_034403 [Papaver californicum]|nr:hypothetical protein MKX01_034403 [Papaver californicum]
MGKKKPSNRDDENPSLPQGGASKSKKKKHVIEDDEYSIDTELYEEPQKYEEETTTTAGKKKGKKGETKAAKPKEEDEDKVVEQDEDDAPVIVFTGKKKSKSKKTGSSFSSSAFDLLNEDKIDDDEEPSVNGDNEKDSVKKDGDEEPPVIAFTGKKKSSKSSKKSSNLFSAALLDEDDNTTISLGDDANVEDEDTPAITFSGKKKSSKSKKNNGSLVTELSSSAGIGEDHTETEPHSLKDSTSEADVKASSKLSDVPHAETSKSKKKKKKSGRTAQEEDDLDKILAELDDAPPIPKPTAPPPVKENVQVQPEPIGSVDATGEEKEAEADTGESAAAKKKKKKKEKEKEKKAAAAAGAEAKQEETKSKKPDKKLPKHVIEMQEALQRRKELEERMRREEEEKERREEEERLRQEELEKQAEEAKRRKKEKEKEKMLKKKQEGKLLTAKQKEEARRLEIMRNQFLANGALPSSEGGAATKRPKYQTKKSKPAPTKANEEPSTSNSVDNPGMKDDKVEVVTEMDAAEVKDNGEVDSTVADTAKEVEVEHENEDKAAEEEEVDWDAKSWDDADVQIPVKSAFGEEVDDETEPVAVVKKETKRATSPDSGTTVKPSTASGKGVPQPLESEDVNSDNDNGPSVDVPDKNRRKDAAAKREARTKEALSKRSEDNLRSPICCIMGHVDTGKTKLLDCIRGTNVQEGEAGGITQQIGATYFPAENIRERTRELKADAKLRVPGLLVIDTPGHESFTNLRSRGSGLCDIAILVVDIMHGLEPQTIESLNLLKMRNTEFIVALNKVDRLYGWKTCKNAPIVKAIKMQSKDVIMEFSTRVTQIITEFKEQGLNSELYYKNKEMGETFSIVPTSAISGEGIPDMLLLLVQWTQKTMVEKLMFTNEIQCTVLEVKVIEGLGTTIDVVLVNGVLHEGDQIVVCGMQGPIVTTIRALLTPHPMKELRIKGSYVHHKELKAAQGVKITAQGLEHAIAGTGLYVVGPEDDVEDIKEATMQDMKTVMSRIDKSGEGVCVQASTLGSLEALLEFLKSPAVNIPVSGISIGPVHKRDVMRASVMLERKKEYATILAFDVKVTPEARELAEESGVKIFIADIIYHLFDQFKAYIDNLKEEKKKDAAEEAVFPCLLQIMPNCVFNKKDPIVLGVDILEGILKIGTPICIPSRDFIDIGRIASIEINHKQVDTAKKGQKVAIKIASGNPEEQQKMFGRHFEMEDELVSHITRKSIDILKANYREDLSIDEWRLVVKLKRLFDIQ